MSKSVQLEFDRDALDRFASEGGPSRREPPRPDSVEGLGFMPGFEPHPMPALQLACPANGGEARRYRMPLWRPRPGTGA